MTQRSYRKVFWITAILCLILLISGTAYVVIMYPQIGALVTGAIGFLIARLYDMWKTREERSFEKRKEVYTEILEPLVRVFSIEEKSRLNKISDSIRQQSVRSGLHLVMYGSDDVIKAYAHFRTLGDNASAKEILGALAKLVLAMRYDVSGGRSRVTLEDVLDSFVSREHKADSTKERRDV